MASIIDTPTVKSHSSARLVALFVVVFVFGPLIWWGLDRTPPYTRSDGVIIPADPEECGLGKDGPRGAIHRGSCVRANWKITPIRSCVPSSRYSVTRWIRGHGEDGALRQLPQVGSAMTSKVLPNNLSRPFVIPFDIVAGKKAYVVSSCFACNPLHHIWPICVTKPDIEFEVTVP